METGPDRELPRDERERDRLPVPDTADDAIYMLDLAGIITTWNPNAKRLSGYEAPEALGRHFSILYSKEDIQSGVPRRAIAVAADDKIFNHEGWFLRKDGSRFWAATDVHALRNEAGEVVGFAKIMRDTTARDANIDALRRSEAQFRLLVQGVKDYAIFLIDRRGHVNSWNPGAENIKGYLPSEIIGKHFSIFYTESDQLSGEPQRALEAAVRDGKFEREGWRVRKDGNVFWANVVINPILGANGELVGFAKITRDMTETKRAELEAARARDALVQSQKMEAIGQLTGGVAHDFNNLLTAILGGLELIQRRVPENPNVTPLLENAIQSALRGRTLTRRMLAFARRQDLTPGPVQLPQLVFGITDLLRRVLGPSIAIETEFPDPVGTIIADSNQLELAILNLATNARDAMTDGGTIKIGARTIETNVNELDHRKYLCLVMTDDGEGMDAATLSRATQPFFTTKSVGSGTGLGLSMVHGFAEQSGGYLTLSSQPGAGTIAELCLPLVTSASAPTAPESDK